MKLSLLDARYTCTGCGDCCRGWSVPLLDGEPERFRRAAEGVVPVERLRGAVSSVRGGAKVASLAGPGGACAALADDDRCLIHAAHGADAKPLACRLFPFTFVATPDDVRVSLSFACPAVVDAEGPPLEAQRAEVAALQASIASTPYQMRVDAAVRLTEERRIEWADAAALLSEMTAALASDGGLVEKMCRAGALVALTIARLDEGAAFSAALAAARAGRDALVAEALAAPVKIDRLSRALLRTLVQSTSPGERGRGSRLWGALTALGGGAGTLRFA
ncbi:MAG: Flagellin N-methylase, partial [Acidobacteria bacterium]|nr:Flagellin N-methylase [Acidobacteriota bacterium]